ncbi:serine/threonine-protein kinase dst1-like isoform X2 [Anneissia japonica]|uniref:serine/threonine-protein kinase dst1-like isoform X2 n=1 Tax=Anneissia japonica TaxID=1529436 RepID=UPI001425BB01|nr:serine/threonine-protein kinase dst1-like isoform X2 [Anneissia japonica]
MFNCKFTGNPKPDVMWLYNGNTITSNAEYILDESNDGNCLMIIAQASILHSGDYICKAENVAGKVQTICSLTVTKQETSSNMDTENKEAIQTKQFYDTPVFESNPEDVYVLQGERANLVCKVLNNPVPIITWLRDHEVISNSRRFQTYTKTDGTCCLDIDDVDYEDIGEYECLAVNADGVKKIMVYLDIAEANEVIIKRTKIEDKYEFFEELGRGAFGITKRCVSFTGGKSFAAKFIELKNGKKEDIYREIEIMSCLHHQKLIKLYDAYETKENVVMVMELVSGGELFERIIDQESFTEVKAAFFIRQVLEGLQYMHSNGVVHLDLKPENILLESEERDDVKLIDFGLARKVSPGNDTTCKQGTPEFVAPEIVKKQPVTNESDLWSVGVIAYILLSGISPFLGDTDKETLLKVKSNDWDFDDAVWDTISDDAKDFITKLLKEDPSARLGAEESLYHTWLKVDEMKYTENEKARLSTIRLKSFNSRRKWQRALTAVKSAVRICRLSSLKSMKSCSKDAQSATATVDPKSKTQTKATASVHTEHIISETSSIHSTTENEGIDQLSDVACLEENLSDWIHKDNALQTSNLPSINRDNTFADMNACEFSALTNHDNVVKEDIRCVLNVHSKETKCRCSRGSDTCISLKCNDLIEHAPNLIISKPNAVVINASDGLGQRLSMKFESSHTISAVTIESSAVGSTVLSDTLVSDSDTVTTLVGFFSEHTSNSITEALPNSAADSKYQLLTNEKPESKLSYINNNTNTESKTNGESSAIASQGSASIRRRRLVKSLTFDQDQQISCTSRRRIYSDSDEPQQNSLESVDSVFGDSIEYIESKKSSSTSSSDSTVPRRHPSIQRPSTLFSISEGTAENGKSTHGEVFSSASSSRTLTKRRSTYQTWSQESQDSIDIPITEVSQEFPLQLNTDIMAADAARQSQSKKRRSGFSFRPGQDSIPANAFLNTSEEETPKMLSVASVMMKLHMNRQTSRSPSTSEESDEAKSKRKTSENIEKKKFTLAGSRELSPEDVETELDFLTTSDDEKLNFPFVYKMWLLKDNQYAHIAIGGLFGIFVAILIKLLFSIIFDAIL